MLNLSSLVDEIAAETVAGSVFYILGFLTHHMIQERKKSTYDKRIKDKSKFALDLIYESEKKFPGKKRGLEKLEYATKRFRDKYKDQSYEDSQDYILKMFNITTLAK